jgi:hypothetical protein
LARVEREENQLRVLPAELLVSRLAADSDG